MSIVTKTGAWFTFGETRLGQGREAAKDFLKANPDIAGEVEKQIRAKMSEVSLPVGGHRGGRIAGHASHDQGSDRRESLRERRERRAADRRPRQSS